MSKSCSSYVIVECMTRNDPTANFTQAALIESVCLRDCSEPSNVVAFAFTAPLLIAYNISVLKGRRVVAGCSAFISESNCHIWISVQDP